MRNVFILSAFLAAAAAAAACTSANDTGPPCVTPTEFPAAQLLYPIPGSVGVSDSVFIVEVAGIGPAGGTVTLTGPGGTIATNPEGAPSPLPSPALSPQPGATPSFFGIPTLASGTTYNVVFAASAPSECVAGQPSGTLGSFATK